MQPQLSVVSPVYEAESCVSELCDRISRAIEAMGVSYEVVLVEDGSRDLSWPAIVAESRKRPGVVKGYRLSRNFGQHAAISAGLELAQGAYVIVMDCDLQDPPEEIPRLYELALRDHLDVILTRSSRRLGGVAASIGSRTFHRVMDLLRGEHLDPAIRSFSILSRQAVSAFVQIRERNRHYLSVLSVLGFRPQVVDVASQPRFAGKSSYSIARRFRHAIDGITAHSARLLYLAILIGFLFGALAILSLVVVIYLGLTTADGVPGWASVVTLILLSTGVLCMLLGIIGMYLAKMYVEVKGRPLYFVSEAAPGVPASGSRGGSLTDSTASPTAWLDG